MIDSFVVREQTNAVTNQGISRSGKVDKSHGAPLLGMVSGTEVPQEKKQKMGL